MVNSSSSNNNNNVKPTGALASLMNLSANKTPQSNSLSSFLSSNKDNNAPRTTMVPSLIFFKYVVDNANKNDNENNKLYGIGSVATKFPTITFHHFTLNLEIYHCDNDRWKPELAYYKYCSSLLQEQKW